MEIDNLRMIKYEIDSEILATAKAFEGKDIELNHGYIMGLCKALSIIMHRILVTECVKSKDEECENGNETV